MLTWGYMLLVVLAGSFVGALFPGVPVWAFMLGGLVLGGGLLVVSVGILKRNDLILKDERTRGNSERAMAWAFRFGIWVEILGIAILDAVPSLGSNGLLLSRGLTAVLVLQYLSFLAFHVFLSRRDLG
jgi:uncharacterized membrane protein